jgi:predicted N-acetyltransferase YhbS
VTSNLEVLVRPMTRRDIDGANEVFDEAFDGFQQPGSEPVPDALRALRTARARQRTAHLLSTDPGGSWVAECDGAIVGMTQAHVRGRNWVLALLAVRPAHQDAGLGRQLLERALAYGRDVASRVIFSSSDPRAIRRYVRAGFELQPTVRLSGKVTRGIDWPKDVRIGGEGDLAAIGACDAELRGARRDRDLEFLLRTGMKLLVFHNGRGYALADRGRLGGVIADSEQVAEQLLLAGLACAAGEEVQIGWVVARQQWAIGVAIDHGLQISPGGPMMTAAWPSARLPWLPNGIFG